MKTYQVIGSTLKTTSAITSLVSAGSIFHGLRPDGQVLPAINYYSMVDQPKNGLLNEIFSVNCRASAPDVSRNIARAVQQTFTGTAYSGMYGTASTFSVMRISLANPSRTIPETAERCFNTVVDVRIVCPADAET